MLSWAGCACKEESIEARVATVVPCRHRWGINRPLQLCATGLRVVGGSIPGGRRRTAVGLIIRHSVSRRHLRPGAIVITGSGLGMGDWKLGVIVRAVGLHRRAGCRARPGVGRGSCSIIHPLRCTAVIGRRIMPVVWHRLIPRISGLPRTVVGRLLRVVVGSPGGLVILFGGAVRPGPVAGGRFVIAVFDSSGVGVPIAIISPLGGG